MSDPKGQNGKPSKRLPENVVPFAKVPRQTLLKLRKIERKIRRVERKHDREKQDELRPLVREMVDAVAVLQDARGLSAEHLPETATGTMCVRYDVGSKLLEVPELPDLDDTEDELEELSEEDDL